MDLSERDIKTR